MRQQDPPPPFDPALDIGPDLRTFLAATVVPVHVLSPDGRILAANPAELELVGRRHGDYVGHALADFHLDPTFVLDLLQQLARGDTTRGLSATIHHGDGSERHVVIDAQAHVANGRFAHAYVFTRDVTEQRRLMDVLRERDAARRLALTAAHAGGWEWDLQTNEVRWSEESYRLFGQEPGAFQPRLDMGTGSMDAADRDRTLAAVTAVLQTGADLDVEYPAGAPGPQQRWFHVRGQVLQGPQGLPRRLVGIMMDVTARKQAEAEREALLAAAEEGKALAEAASRQKDEFLALLSHELRTPLAAMVAWLRVLERQGHDPQTLARGVAVLDRSVQSQKQLIGDLLDVSRIVSGKLALRFERTDVVAIVDACVESVRPAAAAKQLTLTFARSTPVLPVHGDRTRLQQAIGNVLHNAVKFTPPGGAITVRVADDDGHALVEISDTGRGIDPAFLPHVFDRFRQADSSSIREHGGLGLGLAIVRHLVERHRGRVAAASAGIGRGAIFTISLPLIADVPAPAPSRPEPIHLATDSRHVLLIDDDADTLEAMRLALEISGLRISTAGSAAEALAVLDAGVVDIVVSDISMPGTDGYGFLDALRARPAPHPPVIAMTGYAGTEDRERALRSGFNAHLAKPVEPWVLMGVIGDVLDGAATP